MAPRPIAAATIAFGLVSIPVKLFTSTQSSGTIRFRMLDGDTKQPVKQQYIRPSDGKVVARDDMVKGYEYAKDQFVVFTPEELKALEEEATKAIAIEEFVPLETVDPVFFDSAYYVAPEKSAARAYHLLCQAMQQKGLAGLAKYSARGKQYLVCVRPTEKGLVMQQLRYANEVRQFDEVPVEETDVKPAELKLALQLIEQSISKTFDPAKYHDEVHDRVKEVIEQKVEGEEVTFAPSEAPQAQVIDLMEALKASLAGETAAPAKDAKGSSARTTKKAAKKSARKPAKASPRKAKKKTRKAS